MAYRNYSAATSHIVDPNGFGDFTTIGAALTAASSGQTIFIRPGTYTENPTLKTGVSLTAFTGDEAVPNVIINGKCSYTGGGTVSLSNIQLQTNSDFCLSFSGSSTGTIYLNRCWISATSSTGIQFTNSAANSALQLQQCNYTCTGATNALYTMSGTAATAGLSIRDTNGNSGSTTTTASSNSTGSVSIQRCFMTVPLATSSANQFYIQASTVNTNATNTTALAISGTATHTLETTALASGSAVPLTIAATATLNASHMKLDHSNASAVTGTGTLKHAGLVQINTPGNIVPTNQTIYTMSGGCLLGYQIFTGSGTWTRPAGCNQVFVQCWGSGGGGGGAPTAGAGAAGSAGGGGGGSYAASFISAPGASQTITIGAAGTAGPAGSGSGGGAGNPTSFGSLVIAGAGTAGGGNTATSSVISGGSAGGLGGTNTGDISIRGPGGGGGINLGNSGLGGYGGSMNGNIPGAVANGAGVAGSTGIFPGGGGSGAAVQNSSQAAGGAGAAGYCIVYHYT